MVLGKFEIILGPWVKLGEIYCITFYCVLVYRQFWGDICYLSTIIIIVIIVIIIIVIIASMGTIVINFTIVTIVFSQITRLVTIIVIINVVIGVINRWYVFSGYPNITTVDVSCIG